jgi:hypothetical protein
MTNGYHPKKGNSKYKVVGRRKAKKSEADGPIGKRKELERGVRETDQERQQA